MKLLNQRILLNIYKERVDFMVNINNLFKLISMKGITQSKLAEDTSVSTGNISDWKKGKSMPSAVKLDELATYFDCSVDYLLGRTDIPNVSEKYTNRDGIQAIRNGSVIINTTDNEIMSEFASMFQALTTENKIRVMHYALELKGETKNEPNKEV